MRDFEKTELLISPRKESDMKFRSDTQLRPLPRIAYRGFTYDECARRRRNQQNSVTRRWIESYVPRSVSDRRSFSCFPSHEIAISRRTGPSRVMIDANWKWFEKIQMASNVLDRVIDKTPSRENTVDSNRMREREACRGVSFSMFSLTFPRCTDIISD